MGSRGRLEDFEAQYAKRRRHGPSLSGYSERMTFSRFASLAALPFLCACGSDSSPPPGSGPPATATDAGVVLADGGSMGADGGEVAEGAPPVKEAGDPGDAAAPPPGMLKAGLSTMTFTIAGQARSVIVYVPAAVTTGRIPLVLGLHGNGDTNTNFIATSGLKALAD